MLSHQSRRNPDNDVLRLAKLASYGDLAAAEGLANLLRRAGQELNLTDVAKILKTKPLEHESSEVLFRQIQPILQEIQRHSWRETGDLERDESLRMVRERFFNANDLTAPPGELVWYPCSTLQCTEGLQEMYFWDEHIRRSLTGVICSQHRSQAVNLLESAGFLHDSLTFNFPRTRIPFFENRGDQYPGNIQPGLYKPFEMLEMLQRYSYSPDVVDFLASMMET